MTDEPTGLPIDDTLERVPDDRTTAREAVAPYHDMTPAERLAELAKLGGWMDSLLGGREPRSEDGEEPFRRHWKDPTLGRPRGPTWRTARDGGTEPPRWRSGLACASRET